MRSPRFDSREKRRSILCQVEKSLAHQAEVKRLTIAGHAGETECCEGGNGEGRV
jgi:hypothetical protein